MTGKTNVSALAWSPDGTSVAFLMRRGDKAQTQVWSIPLNGGEAAQLTNAPDGVLAFRWHPSGKQIGYIALQPKTAREKALESKGYGFIFYEENIRNRNLALIELGKPDDVRWLTAGINVWSFVFTPDGKRAAVAASPRNLVDESYMFQKISLLDLETLAMTALFSPPGSSGRML